MQDNVQSIFRSGVSRLLPLLLLAAIVLCGARALLAESRACRIGVLAPLAGELAAYGVAVQSGVAFAVEDTPGRSAQVVYEDNGYDAQAAISALRSLVSLKGADLLFSWGEVPLQAVAPIAERTGVPVVAMSVDAKPAEGKEWVVVGVNPAHEFVAQLWGALRQRGARRVGVLVSEDPFMFALVEELRRGASAGEVVELIGTVAPTEHDLRALAVRVARAPYDALGVLLMSGQIGTFYRELHKVKFSGFTFGTDCFESPTEVASAGEEINGAVYVSLDVPDDFRGRYMQRVGTLSQVGWAYHAYLTTVWLRTLLPDTCPSDRREILRLIQSTPLPAGLQRYRSPGGVRHIVFPLSPKRVAGGSFVRLAP